MRKHQPASTLDRAKISARPAGSKPVAKERTVPISAAFDSSDRSPLRIDAQFIVDQEISPVFFEIVEGFATSMLAATVNVVNFQRDASGSIRFDLNDLAAPPDPLDRDGRLSVSAADTRRLHLAAEAHAKSCRSRSAEIFNEEIRHTEQRAIIRSILETLIKSSGSAEHVSRPLGENYVRALRACLDALHPPQSPARRGRPSENDDVELFLRHASLLQRGYTVAAANASLKRQPEEDEREVRRRVSSGRELALRWGLSSVALHAGGK